MAKALDLVGQRWTLLVVRELLSGGRRFGALLDGLPGISASLLTDRLRTLTQAGLLAHSDDVYSLTESGESLVPSLRALAGRGVRFLGPPGEAVLRPRWFLIALEGIFRPERAIGVKEDYELRAEGEPFHLAVSDGRVETYEGPASQPDLVISADAWTTLLALNTHTLDPLVALQGRQVRILGPTDIFLRYVSLFDSRTRSVAGNFRNI